MSKLSTTYALSGSIDHHGCDKTGLQKNDDADGHKLHFDSSFFLLKLFFIESIDLFQQQFHIDVVTNKNDYVFAEKNHVLSHDYLSFKCYCYQDSLSRSENEHDYGAKQDTILSLPLTNLNFFFISSKLLFGVEKPDFKPQMEGNENYDQDDSCVKQFYYSI